MGAREDVFDCEVSFVTVEAVWGGVDVWVDNKGLCDACMTYS